MVFFTALVINDIFFFSDEESDAEINILTADKQYVLEFFREATPKELQLMPTCSKKKIETILSLRPFTSWMDLVSTNYFLNYFEYNNVFVNVCGRIQKVRLNRNVILISDERCVICLQ